MENAAKALIIAGGVLIGIIIASIFTYEMIHMSENARVYHEQLELTQITEFNQQFHKYASKEYITAQDVVTIYNFVNEWNRNSSETIDIDTTESSTKDISKLIDEKITVETFISNANNAIEIDADGNIKEKRYKLTISNRNTNGRINKVIINEI